MPNSWLIIPRMLIDALDVSALASVGVIFCTFVTNWKWQIPVYAIMWGWWLMFVVLLGTVALENMKETLSTLTQYYMNAYVFKIGSYYDETPDHDGVKLKSGASSNLKMISELLVRSPGHWAVVIIAYIVLIGSLIFLGIYGYKLRHKR